MLTRKNLAERWKTTPRTIDRRRALGLLPWIDLTQGPANAPKSGFASQTLRNMRPGAALS